MGVTFTSEQQAVIDARNCNILVSAAAGSGKTAVLVERIIQMILEGYDIDHLLVVTFTKAAAAQMKEKITLAIQKRLLEEPDNKHLQKQETLIHNAQITTIDSFCQYVLRNNFNAIGIDPSFRVADDGELRLLQEEVMQDMLENEYESCQDGDDFTYCMEYFSTGSNDKKVEEYISQLYRFSMSMPWPEDWINERARDYKLEGKPFEELDFVKSCVEMAQGEIKEYISRLDAAQKLCLESDGPYMYGDTLDADKASVSALLQYNTYDQLFDGLRTVSFGRLPGKKDDSVNPAKKEKIQEIRKSIKDGISKLIDTYFALPSETVVKQMELCDRAVNELCRLTLLYKQLFDEKKREKQLIDFSDMEHFALRILVNHPDDEKVKGKSCQEIIDMCTPSAVALEYREYYREVLIDEYQDSNNVQELILKSISGEIPDKSERFMVGDVKQSIYKFRLARPEIFMEKLVSFDKKEGAENRRIDLHKNFRSRKEVLEATNYIFEKIMGPDLGSVDYDQDALLVPGAAYDEPVMDITPELIMFESTSDNDALLEYDAREKEALVISQRIHSLMQENRELKYKDIVILLRSLSGWDDTFKKILEEQGIPVYIESKSGYFDAWEVAILLDLLTIVDNPGQDIPLVSVMHSAIGDFNDEELARLRVLVNSDENAAFVDSFYLGLKVVLASLKDDSDKLIVKLSKFISFIEELRELSVYTPVHELLQYVLDKTGFDTYCLAMPAGNQRKANIDQLLSRALAFEKTSFKGLFHFVRYIEHMKLVQVDYGEAGIIDENADVVRIMSIHKSKGLEFPVVFVSGLTKNFNRMDVKGDLIADMDMGVGVRCINSQLRLKYDTLKRVIIGDKMVIDSLGEELRVLYVALTRAKEKLILTAAVKKLLDTIAAATGKLPVIAGGDKLLPYSLRAGASSYFDLILLSAVRHPGFAKMVSSLGISGDDFKGYLEKKDEVPLFSFKIIGDQDIEGSMLQNETVGIGRKQELLDLMADFDDEGAKRLKAKFESKYAYENLKGLFTKTTVTELKKHMLQEKGEVFGNMAFDQEERALDADMPIETAGTDASLDGELQADKVKKLSGAERGTAYHRIMEILDKDIYGDEAFMENVNEKDSPKLDDWIKTQVKKGMIPDEYPANIEAGDIITFLKTDLGKRMGAAFRKDNLYREKPFMMGIPASELNEKFPQEEMVLIQGIIDAWFIEDGQIVLLDYKTDKVKKAEELVDRYSIQLELYKKALERTTNMVVKEVLIYSFALGSVVPLEI
nr:helicase-exonuclease AddAB subunit AddA [uncultured Butyrivibrio sp.]